MPLLDIRDTTVQSGRSILWEFTVSDYHDTSWFRDSYGYMRMYDHSGRYIMTDRDPKTLDLPQRVISGPTEFLQSLGPMEGSVRHTVSFRHSSKNPSVPR